MNYVKSTINGQWYAEKTEWNYVHDALCDALAYFSETDLNHELYIIIDHVADEVYKKLKK